MTFIIGLIIIVILSFVLVRLVRGLIQDLRKNKKGSSDKVDDVDISRDDL